MVVAKAVAELEAEWMILRLQLLADLVELFPGIGKLLDADLGKSIGAPVHQLANVAERDRLLPAFNKPCFFGDIVPTALVMVLIRVGKLPTLVSS